MSGKLVKIKGNRDGLYIDIKDEKFDLVKKHLKMKLNSARDFFKGGKVISFKGKSLSDLEKEELKSLIEDEYDIKVECKVENEVVEEDKTVFFDGINEGQTKFIRTTLRSGQSIEYDGNIVVLGDVNPGANIKAKGNIIVLGTLRGVAHAGYDGNREAIISAFKLYSKQVRIADIISRCPDDDLATYNPEIAMIKDNIIVIEPYLHKNIK